MKIRSPDGLPRLWHPSALAAAGLLALSAVGCGSEGDAHDGDGPAGTPDGGGADHDAPPARLTCRDEPPEGATVAPDPKPYGGGACPALTTGPDAESKIVSSGVDREFMLIVPGDMKSDEKLPVVFFWHWLNASASSFYERASVQEAVDQQRFIAVLPEGIGNGLSNWRGWLTLNPESQRDEEFVFFDDVLACVSEQFPVNKNCVSSAGVSDGALWTSQLIGGRGEYLASALVLSGGVQSPDDTTTNVLRPYLPSTAHPMPVLVLWGGPNDTFVINFAPASQALEQHLVEEGHFLVECQHNCGHDEPPFEPPPGKSKFAAFWEFVYDHPYWLPPGDSPYNETGLPPSFPEWCAIGMGQATPRTGEGCANLIGMALGTAP